MLKRSMVILMVVALIFTFSFSALALPEDKAKDKNDKVQVHIEKGEGEIHFMDAVNENAKGDDSGNPDHPNNPIVVAGT